MKTIHLLGTPLLATSHDELIAHCQNWAQSNGAIAVDFTNTHIVTLRRADAAFRQDTEAMDYFVPDSMPLKWCLNLRGARMKDRLYGPDFMRRCVVASPAPVTHYLLGGSGECLHRLEANLRAQQPNLLILGRHHGYFGESDSPEIVGEINRLSPDFIWVGLGTPKQQAWIRRWKSGIHRGVLFAVGFAFDANAGTKKDSPRWMQRAGLGWLYRLLAEPTRLGPRYLKYNSLFLWYLLADAARGRAYQSHA
ncbi:MAG TPA: glycosyltransferase [Verrucomicrobiales bacterium]|nr:glycosyltransferase [Verrucomicrobiales bacterium]